MHDVAIHEQKFVVSVHNIDMHDQGVENLWMNEKYKYDVPYSVRINPIQKLTYVNNTISNLESKYSRYIDLSIYVI